MTHSGRIQAALGLDYIHASDNVDTVNFKAVDVRSVFLISDR